MFDSLRTWKAPVAKLRRHIARRRHASLAGRSRDEFAKGSAEWLVLTELKYGGIQRKVPRLKVSEKDPRTPEQLAAHTTHTGGDRMSAMYHGYARKYAQHLKPFLREEAGALTLVEAGILRGTGLAIWADLFEGATIIGLDIDLSHFEGHLPTLRSLGAFRNARVSVHEFDQFVDNTELLGRILHGRRIDVMIDDGHHTEETILSTFASARPHLGDRFVYFVEDNATVWRRLRAAYPAYNFDCCGELTVVHLR